MSKYLLLANLLFAFTYLFYLLFLRKQTFFQLNRFLLLAILLGSVLLPLISLPIASPFSWEKKATTTSPTTEHILSEVSLESAGTYSSAFQNNLQAIPASEKNTWWSVLSWVYWAGVSIMAGRFLMQLFSLLAFLKRAPKEKKRDYTLVEVDKEVDPFSFFWFIIIQQGRYSKEVLANILAHEKIHLRQKHSLDLFLTELILIFFWFNPFCWHFRRTLELNLEYLTDQEMVSAGINKKSYQYNLLAMNVTNIPNSLITSFNHYSLKKRIIMMNTKKSSNRNVWRYAIFVPIFLAFLFINATESSNTLSLDFEKPLFVFFTEDASEKEIIVLQDYLFEQKYQLNVDELVYNSKKKINKLALTLRSSTGSRVSFFDEASPDEDLLNINGFKIFSDRSGTAHLHLKDWNEIRDQFSDITLLLLNGSENPHTISDLVVNLTEFEQLKTLAGRAEAAWKAQRRKTLEAQNWQSIGNGATTYQDLTEEKMNSVRRRLTTKTDISYFLDGIQREATILEIAPEKIARVSIIDEHISTFDKVTLEIVKKESKTLVKMSRKLEPKD